MRRFIHLAAGPLAILGSLATSASAVDVDHGIFGEAYATWTCGPGTNSWTCAYELFSTDCTEASVGTGTQINVIARCSVHVKGSIAAQYRFTAGNQRAGCTSVAGSTSSMAYVSYDSAGSAFDNDEIAPITIEARDGVVTYTATEHDGIRRWVAQGHFAASCLPSTGSSNQNATAVGSVTVQM